jgi:hypothetical protein
MEGVMVGKDISIANLIYSMKTMLSEVFDNYGLKVRLRPGFFPFVEPGFELDISCQICGGEGCPSCKHSGWLELCPCGMIHPNVLKEGGLQLDLEFRRCLIDGEEVKLTRKEFELLAYLIKHRGKICSREQILSRVWSDEVLVLDRTIDVNITRLRSKIGAYGSYIVTRSGFGYGFRD